MRAVRIALAQHNFIVGDLAGNAAIIREQTARAREAGASIVAFPELALTGYPPEDLVLRRSFCGASRGAMEALAPATAGIIAVVGFIDWAESEAYNAAAIFSDGRLVDIYHKQRLPNYGVFDEERYFARGRRTPVYDTGDFRFGVLICEDIWVPGPPLDAISLGGAELCININGSPYHRGKARGRERMLATRAADNMIALAYLNLVGGQDELVFDGGSVVFDAEGEVVARALQFAEELVVVDVDLDEVQQRRRHDARRRTERPAPGDHAVVPIAAPVGTREALEAGSVAPPLSEEEEVWKALVMGTRDYVAKTGFHSVLIALSGGIDSTVVAAIAVDALGPDHVVCVAMPSRYSSDHSIADAELLARNLGVRLLTIPIEPAHAAMLEMLADVFEGTAPGTAEENLQSRQRANVIMTLSNKFGAGWMVLTTGNKSEMATGYATLYGDMAGGYAVIKDVPKTLVYRLAQWRNTVAGADLIPRGVIEKPPSAELKPGQLDQDSLPPYEVLDPIIEAYVEDDRTIDEIVALGFEEATVRRVAMLVDRNEYKRRQAPPGVKITPRAFGRDRRFPLAGRWGNLP